MVIENVKEVEVEVKRFFKRLKEFKESDYNKHLFDENSKNKWIMGDKTSGALRRASLDLSRSLSKMRTEY
tara:strand:+ start:645 stop:854 length:210 start_codon:yes stop_codon:yes gene_type:complete